MNSDQIVLYETKYELFYTILQQELPTNDVLTQYNTYLAEISDKSMEAADIFARLKAAKIKARNKENKEHAFKEEIDGLIYMYQILLSSFKERQTNIRTLISAEKAILLEQIDNQKSAKINNKKDW